MLEGHLGQASCVCHIKVYSRQVATSVAPLNIHAFLLFLTTESRSYCPQLPFFCNLQEVGLLGPGYIFQDQVGSSIQGCTTLIYILWLYIGVQVVICNKLLWQFSCSISMFRQGPLTG